MNSPNPDIWVNRGGTVWQEVDSKVWVYQDAAGNTVRYPDGYPDFSPYERQHIDVPDLKGNHSKTGNGDFAKTDRMAPKGPANYDVNTWHHDQNGRTMREIPKNIHGPFTHRGGVSNIKKCGGGV
ncbi:HNH endonuclease [Escherichia albertii]|uniref:HNH endonuclease n=1 Tax=Escherichia albertii TaxID=208962 RepID=UPI002119FEC6|nr:HNH endonuclease [Escherichia albertii]MCQ8936119.1 HNH endonuclease [Escherichia albertii]UUL06334.1 HNH endonuclease [Escherichia albertii]HEB1565686.1 HNH endonuclease [Escherichia albertii]HEB1607964.1 HNH endonuclease [Escherichia albertii]